MKRSHEIVKLAVVRALVKSDAVQSASLVGEQGGWSVTIRHGQVASLLAGTNGKPRLFAKADTAIKQLLDLGLSKIDVVGKNYHAASVRASRPDRSAAMAAANDYARWLRSEAEHTAQRVASGRAKLFTQAQAEARGARKRAELQQRRKDVD